MLTSTAGTEDLPEQRLAHQQRQLIECRLVVSELAILFEERGSSSLQLSQLGGELDQFLAKGESVEVGGEQRLEGLSRAGRIGAGRRRREPEAAVQRVYLAGHGGKRGYA